jgi:hypothetical protein
MYWRTALACCALLTTVAVPAAAQAPPPDSKWAVGGIGGLGKTWDDESDIGTGVLLGARVERVLVAGLVAEGGVDWLSHDRTGGVGFQSEGHTTFVSGVLKYRWGNEGGNGYVLGGGTLANHSGTNSFDTLSRDVSSTNPGLVFGGGAAFGAGRRWEIGPEARMVILWTGDESSPAFAIYGGVRVAFKP